MQTLILAALELALGLVATILGAFTGVAPLAAVTCDAGAALTGTAAAAPLLLGFLVSWRSEQAAMRAIRARVEQAVARLFPSPTLGRLALVSAAAGIGEELLFRGFLQALLAGFVGDAAALVVASAAFGLAHAVTRTYAIVAGVIGAYLGGLWMVTGSLTAPIVTHALYDFVALAVVTRSARRMQQNGGL